jgi:glycosyltransferase involved in cell wall biosynthesis
MKLIIEKSVVVVTPTIGSPKLADAVESVANQTYKNLTHLLVIDGAKEYLEQFNKNLVHQDKDNWNLEFMFLPYNTGANGFNGQRIYASIPHLVDADYVFFLDEDNWYEPDHVKTLVSKIEEENLDWAYSLRKAYTPDKKYIADDNCESLGKWPIYFTHNDPQYLIDTSTFAFKRQFIKATCHLWHSGAWGEDRRFFYAIKDKSKWNTTGKHTLCYRVDNNPNSVNEEFFVKGNAEQLAHYKGQLPWLI